jgi:hypothetical protein
MQKSKPASWLLRQERTNEKLKSVSSEREKKFWKRQRSWGQSFPDLMNQTSWLAENSDTKNVCRKCASTPKAEFTKLKTSLAFAEWLHTTNMPMPYLPIWIQGHIRIVCLVFFEQVQLEFHFTPLCGL